jgi:hypothetical protein
MTTKQQQRQTKPTDMHKTRRGRPRVGLGAEKIRISVERGLLRAADAFAKQNGLTRSELVARGLRTVLVAAGYSGRGLPV